MKVQRIGRAFTDRFEHLGDPAFVKAPWDELVSKPYAREVAQLYDTEHEELQVSPNAMEVLLRLTSHAHDHALQNSERLDQIERG